MTELSSSAPAPTLVIFARGVIAILNTWAVLRLAVEQSWGGPDSTEKQRWLAGAVVDAFESAATANTPDVPYVEEMLLQVMQDEFEVNVEDDSAADVARQIVQLWATAGDAQQAAVEALEVRERRARSKKVVAEHAPGASDEEWDETDDDESGADDDVVDQDGVPQLIDRSTARQHEEPEVDEEGFTVVKKGNRSAR